MALSYVAYTGTGAQTDFTFPFSYIAVSDVSVFVNGVSVPFTFLSTSSIRCTVAPAAAAAVQIRRNTAKLTSPVVFQDGSNLRGADLNLLATWALYEAQESADVYNDLLGLSGAPLVTSIASAVQAAASAVQAAGSASTAAGVVAALASPTAGQGSSLATQASDTAGTQVMNLFNILKERTSFTRYLSAAKQTDVLSGALTLDCSTELATALAERAGKKLTIPGMVRVSQAFTVLDSTILEGESRNGHGIVQYAANTPILKVYGEHSKVANMMLKYSSLAAVTDTDSVAIRGYNAYESIFDNLYVYNSFGGFDQFQGLVGGSQNAWFSNNVSNVRIVRFRGWAIMMKPFSGGNSGNVWSNIYINNANGGGPTGDLACLGGVWFEASDDGTVDQLNIEWCKNTGPLLVLNQTGSIAFRGLHLEGNYPQSAFSPLIDILGGGGATPTFESITLAGNNWSGASGQGLFRIDSLGSKVRVGAIKSALNTTPANMSAILTGGATSYGSTIEVTQVIDLDGSLQTDAYTPKASVGSVVQQTEYPVQRWNLNVAGHNALLTDNAGGSQSAVVQMPGSVANPSYEDPMGLWDTTNSRFNIKQPAVYTCAVTIPTAVGAFVAVQKNGVTIATLSLGTGGAASVRVSCARFDFINFVLASGSYTRTKATCGVVLGG